MASLAHKTSSKGLQLSRKSKDNPLDIKISTLTQRYASCTDRQSEEVIYIFEEPLRLKIGMKTR